MRGRAKCQSLCVRVTRRKWPVTHDMRAGLLLHLSTWCVCVRMHIHICACVCVCVCVYAYMCVRSTPFIGAMY